MQDKQTAEGKRELERARDLNNTQRGRKRALLEAYRNALWECFRLIMHPQFAIYFLCGKARCEW